MPFSHFLGPFHPNFLIPYLKFLVWPPVTSHDYFLLYESLYCCFDVYNNLALSPSPRRRPRSAPLRRSMSSSAPPSNTFAVTGCKFNSCSLLIQLICSLYLLRYFPLICWSSIIYRCACALCHCCCRRCFS